MFLRYSHIPKSQLSKSVTCTTLLQRKYIEFCNLRLVQEIILNFKFLAQLGPIGLCCLAGGSLKVISRILKIIFLELGRF